MTPSRDGAASEAVVKRQQNFRLPADLVGRVEAAVAAGRVPDKSAAVVEALWLWLSPGGEEMLRAAAAAGMSLERIAEIRDEEAEHRRSFERLMVNMGNGPTAGAAAELPEGYKPLPITASARVGNAAGLGTVLRLEDVNGSFLAGDLVCADFSDPDRVTTPPELMLVRGLGGQGIVTDLVLYVDRGVGGSASAIRVGDRVTVVGRAVLESEEARADGEPGRAEAARRADLGLAPPVPVEETSPGDDRAGSEATELDGGGVGANSGLEGVAAPAGLPASPAPGERGAEPAPAARDGQAAGPPGEPAPSVLAVADLPDARYEDEPELVDLAAWLSERLGKPVALTRHWLAAGRVTVDGALVTPGHFTEGASFPAGQLPLVEVDGKRVL